MPHYICPKKQLHFIDSEDFEYLLPTGSKKIDESEVELYRTTIEIKLSYDQLRAAEYPPMTDYLDAIVKDDKAAIQAYIDKCKAIKEKYPKE